MMLIGSYEILWTKTQDPALNKAALFVYFMIYFI